MSALTDALKQYQANTVVYASTAHGFHWNVEGPLFTEFHEFFDEVYEDLDGTLDMISEFLRKLRERSPYTLTEFIANNNVGNTQIDSTSPIVMTRVLYQINEKFISDIKQMFDIATQEREQGIANFLADRQDQHEKWSWFMRSILTSTVN